MPEEEDVQPNRTSKTKTSANKSLFDAFTGLGGLLVPWAALAYSVGLIITNAQLFARFHIVSFTLNRPEYILIGVVWLFLTALLGQVIHIFAVEPGPRRWTRLSAPRWAWARFAVAGILLAVILALLSGSRLAYRQCFILAAALTVFVYFATQLSGILNPSSIWKPLDGARAKKSGWSTTASVAWSLLLWVLVYAILLFPKLAPFLGGPDWPSAILVLQASKTDSQSATEQLLSPIKVHDSVTELVRVIWVDSDYVAIAQLNSSGHAILVNRSLINSIKYR